VSGVVGALWSVNDLSTALLMVRFYELHWQGDAGNGEGPLPPERALRRAQCWLRDVTNEELRDYVRRHREMTEARQCGDRMSAAMVSAGLWQAGLAIAQGRADERPYHDPYHWAAFTFHGA